MSEAISALDLARKVLKTEADAILGLMDRLDGEFERAVQLLFSAIQGGAGAPVVHETLPTSLVVRESSGAAAVSATRAQAPG